MRTESDWLSVKFLPAVAIALAVIAVGCGASGSDPSPEPTPTFEGLEAGGRATRVMFELYVDPYENNSGGVQLPALVEALKIRGPGLIPPLVEITRFALDDDEIAALGDALNQLTGESFAGDDFFSWYEWLGDQENVVTLPGYASWKAQLYSPFDQSFHQFLYDGVPSEIPLHGIQWGGVARDGIPPLENPRVVPGNEAAYLDPDEFVFGVVINGESRAYPFRIMNSHEMANDVLGGVSISLAYCTLCGSGIVYVGEVDGHSETFGTSGFLNQSNKLMYDRSTNTLWQQQTGIPVVGELAGSGVRLRQLPVTVSRWEEWLWEHPGTTALDINQGFRRSYHHPDDPAAIYFEYFHGEELLFPVWDQDTTLDAKTRVLGVRFGEQARAYIATHAIEANVINDELAGVGLVIIGDSESSAVRAYRSGGNIFRSGESPNRIVDQDGRQWEVSEDVLSPVGHDAASLQRQVGQDVFWFGWTTFFPETELWLPSGAS